ncbi:hypothetical protein D9M71_742350 [compost metagenome]
MGIDTWRTSAEAIAWMNCDVNRASRCTLSVITNLVDTEPNATATVPITAMLMSENQRSRLNGCLREFKRISPWSDASVFASVVMDSVPANPL